MVSHPYLDLSETESIFLLCRLFECKYKSVDYLNVNISNTGIVTAEILYSHSFIDIIND